VKSDDSLRFPIGPFHPRPALSDVDRGDLITALETFPREFRAAVEGLSPAQLDTPYRPEGWTARQVVHHVPDSHLQGYVRFKLAVTEAVPTIKTYNQSGWGDLTDARTAPVEPSLLLLEGLHARWGAFLRSLSQEAFDRSYNHPEMGEVSLDTTVQLYVWHGRHHLAHVGLVAGRS
jgi:hypothetical protein